MFKNVYHRLRVSNFYLFEIFILITKMINLLPKNSMNYLVQDKHCLFTFNQTAQFCLNLHIMQSTITSSSLPMLNNNNNNSSKIDDEIMAYSTQFDIYK